MGSYQQAVFCLVLLCITTHVLGKHKRVNRQGVVLLTDETQRELLAKARNECFQVMRSAPAWNDSSAAFCPRVWDTIMCWPDAAAGTMVQQSCPDHINLFKIDGIAVRECTDSGEWFEHPATNRTWTNYTDCVGHIDSAPQLIEMHMGYLRIMYTTGYGVSLISLIIAVVIMAAFKKLHCPRNTVHINLFVSFILRAALSFLKESFMTNGIGLDIDVEYDKYNRPMFTDGPWSPDTLSPINCKCSKEIRAKRNVIMRLEFATDSISRLRRKVKALLSAAITSKQHLITTAVFYVLTSLFTTLQLLRSFLEHVECKLLLSLFMYSLSANYIWIFVEALYLHMLIFVSVFSESSSVWGYVVLGWALPLTFVIPWIAVRALLDDIFCWNTYSKDKVHYKWIVEAPITISIIVNFLLFINVVRVLFTKLNASSGKLAKSTLVLIPLFGVHYVVLLWVQEGISEPLELAKLYFEMFFNSFQGFIVAILFCYTNGEVKAELRKKWYRFRLRHSGTSRRRGSRRGSWSCATTVTRAVNNSVRNPKIVIHQADKLEATALTEEQKVVKEGNGVHNGRTTSNQEETRPMIRPA